MYCKFEARSIIRAAPGEKTKECEKMLDGIINIKKEKGYTSHDVVARLRGILGQRKIGHTGTLDPDATGVLPVCLGKATKLCELLADKEKTYQAVLLLGKVTDTQDVSGNVLNECQVSASPEEIQDCAQGFQGDSLQVPPMYSACRMQGRRLYEWAREGVELERPPRPIHIRRIVVHAVRPPRVWLEVACSKGTYIRTLCHDIGQRLGCGGCMEELVRTRVGAFCLEEALTLGQVECLLEEGELSGYIASVEDMLGQYPKLVCTGQADRLVRNGNPIPFQEGVPVVPGWIRIYDSQGQFRGIYQQKQGTGKYFPVKMFL